MFVVPPKAQSLCFLGLKKKSSMVDIVPLECYTSDFTDVLSVLAVNQFTIKKTAVCFFLDSCHLYPDLSWLSISCSNGVQKVYRGSCSSLANAL